MIEESKCLSVTTLHRSRRSFLKTSVAHVGITPLAAGILQAQSNQSGGPLIAYVGTFSSPLRDMLPTQVDLPPGNGRGIHLFQVNRSTGALTPAGVHEMGTSPSCLVVNASGTRLYSTNETGRLEFTGHYAAVGNPSIIVFLDLAKVE